MVFKVVSCSFAGVVPSGFEGSVARRVASCSREVGSGVAAHGAESAVADEVVVAGRSPGAVRGIAAVGRRFVLAAMSGFFAL
jgi:hypothetical protein